MNWSKVSPNRHQAEEAPVAIKKSFSGWGANYNPYAKRVWAIEIEGELLVNKADNVRTFASIKTAKEAAEKAWSQGGN